MNTVLRGEQFNTYHDKHNNIHVRHQIRFTIIHGVQMGIIATDITLYRVVKNCGPWVEFTVSVFRVQME